MTGTGKQLKRNSGCLDIHGILSVVQTPFDFAGELDLASLRRLVEDAITAGVDGFLAPVVASEVAFLSAAERERVVDEIAETANSRVHFIVGASTNDPAECRAIARQAASKGAAAYLVAVPTAIYKTPSAILPFFQEVIEGIDLPLVIQDFEFNGPGMDMPTIRRLKEHLPTLVGVKIETVPAGPKYTAVREAFGPDFFIAGGWAVPQFIEALDRGVDAMIPESSMIRVYKRIQRRYERGDRDAATTLFHRLLPILAFTNQDVGNSILFFKYLLVRKGIFRTTRMRYPEPGWDRYSLRVAEELIELYLELEEGDQ